MSGVEPFILCALCLHVDVSRIAVMGSLIAVMCLRNTILSCGSVPFLGRQEE